jgi:2-methylcitrate dehydratase PrpD
VSPTLAEQLAAFAAQVRADGPPADVVDSVAQRVLDTLGICVAAADLATSRAARRWVADTGGAGQAGAVGVLDRVPAASAAFVNGVLAHSLDYDDTHLPSVLHPSASIVPAALAAGERARATGADVVSAIAVGLEVCVRLGMAGYDTGAGNSMFFEFGQHATSICGAMGSAVAAAMLLGADEKGIVDALGVAASMSSGIIEANRTGGTVKRVHCGWAAHAGVSAAELVAYGLTGPPTVLEGRFGFFQAWLHGSDVHLDAVTDGLGDRWSVPDIFFKPYPANHFTHAGIDAAIRLRERGLDVAEIEHIELRVAAAPHRTIGQPIEVKRAPDTGYMAQFSGPYTVVAGLLGGGGLGVGLADFTDELAHDPERRRLMALVDVIADDRCTKIFPHQFPAIVTVRTRDGGLWAEEVLANRGGPGWPLSIGELAEKFSDNASRLLDPQSVDELKDACGRINDLPEVTELVDGLRGIDPLDTGATHEDPALG